MDGRKLLHFVCFAVTMGLVACASGNSTSTSAATSTATVLLNETTMEPTPPVNSTVNSTTTELDPTPGFTSSRPAPSNAVTPSVRTTATSESKSCPTELAEEKNKKNLTAYLLIIAGALLYPRVMLLVTVMALACKVSYLRGWLSGSRSTQINDAGRWGVAETSVMLEEVTPVRNEEETATAAEPGGAQAAADEADRGPTAAAAAAPELDPDPVESPKTQTAPAPTSEPTADKA